jgi:hypothetical protein
MIRVGDKVRIKDRASAGKVIRVISIVQGVVLNNPLAVIRLDAPDEFSLTLTTAFDTELEVLEPAAERAGA